MDISIIDYDDIALHATNFAPSPAELLLLRASLEHLSREASQIQDRLRVEPDPNVSWGLHLSIIALRDKYTGRQALLGHCRKLPPEILGQVFIHCLPEFGDLSLHSNYPLPAPWLLGHVCRRWRRIALGTPVLWSAIAPPWRRSALEMVSACLDRAGAIALDLDIAHLPFPPETDDVLLLQLLGRHIARYRSISCRLHFICFMDFFVRDADVEAPHLETLKIQGLLMPDMDWVGGRLHAPRLRSLSCNATSPIWDSLMFEPSLLSRLSLHTVNSEVYYKVLQATPRLHDLTMAFHDASQPLDARLPQIQLLALEELWIAWNVFPDFSLLALLDARNLRRLDLSSSTLMARYLDSEHIGRFIAKCPSLQILALERMIFIPESYAAVFRQPLENLQVILIDHSQLDGQFFTLLTGGVHPLCPKLRQMEIKNTFFPCRDFLTFVQYRTLAHYGRPSGVSLLLALVLKGCPTLSPRIINELEKIQQTCGYEFVLRV